MTKKMNISKMTKPENYHCWKIKFMIMILLFIYIYRDLGEFGKWEVEGIGDMGKLGNLGKW